MCVCVCVVCGCGCVSVAVSVVVCSGVVQVLWLVLDSGTTHIHSWQFLALKYFVTIFSGMLNFVLCVHSSASVILFRLEVMFY